MIKNLLCKTLFLLAIFFNGALAQAQENQSTFTESSLPDKGAKEQKNSEDKKTKNTVSQGGGGGLADFLLGKKSLRITSLMFSDEEDENIDRAVDALKNNQVYTPEEKVVAEDAVSAETKKKDEAKKKGEKKPIEENEKSYIYLASLIYFTPNDWVLWINDKKITPTANKKENELYVKKVDKDTAKIIWKLSISKWKVLSGRKSEELAPKINAENKVEVEFDLRPNQTFILSATKVVEGRAVIALLKQKQEERNAAEKPNKQPSR